MSLSLFAVYYGFLAVAGGGESAVVAAAVKVVVGGVRANGFKGRAPHLVRELENGTLQMVHVHRQRPFRDPDFSVDLSVIPGALLRGWQATGHWALKMYRSGASGIGFSTNLDWADGRLEAHQHEPSTSGEGTRVAIEVLDQFARSGLRWLATWSDARGPDVEQLRSTVQRSESDAQAVAALQLDLRPTPNADLDGLTVEVIDALCRWRDHQLANLEEREAQLRSIVTWGDGEDSPIRNGINLDAWLLRGLGGDA